jgi:hypothetical protein
MEELTSGIILDNASVSLLTSAIVTQACEDVLAWQAKLHKYGYDYPDDPCVPEMPKVLHKALRRKKTPEEKAKARRLFITNFYTDMRNAKRNAEDAERFLMNKDGWFEMMCDIDGQVLLREAKANGWAEKRNKYYKKREEKKHGKNNRDNGDLGEW